LRPLTVITGIVLGSSAATTFGLSATFIVFLVLSGEHPQFQSELPLLGRYLLAFIALTTLSGFGFLGLAKNRPWRWWAQAAMWGSLALLAALYWSTRRG
jgi:hypothetical protein